MSQSIAERPSRLDIILDHTLDVDSHEMAPSNVWGEVFGQAAGQIGVLAETYLKRLGGNDIYNPAVQADDAGISEESVWFTRGVGAPGAFNFERRLAVMDMMGIDKQLVFPTYAFVAATFLPGSGENMRRRRYGLTIADDEIDQLGRAGVDEYNEWALRTTTLDPTRMRAVVAVHDNGTPEDLIERVTELIHRGARAINLPTGTPPGGLSPADPKLDPLWEMLEKHDVSVVSHIGSHVGFLKAQTWGSAPAFAPGKVESHEIGLEPYGMATCHVSVANFLTILTLGGVFERFPKLRFGAIETGSIWLGPLAEELDMWATGPHKNRLRPFISRLPSEYFARNVRVTPFNVFEPIEDQFLRYPHLQDCYCYSTDYPHIEGGKDIKRVLATRLAPMGDEILEKFFVSSGQLLFPESAKAA